MKDSSMADKNSATRRNAESHFTAAEAREAMVRSEIAKERASFEARTIKLKALRLAKEEADRVEKARLDALNPPKPKAAARKKAAAKA
jgi:hypothetical protein